MTATDFCQADKATLEKEFKRRKSWSADDSVSCFYHDKCYALFLVVIEDSDEDRTWLDTMVFSVTVSITGEWEIKQMKAV